MHTSRLSVAAALIAIVVAILSGCKRDVDYLPAERAARNEIVSSLEVFRKDIGRYPTVCEGLQALLREPSVRGWRGPYYSESKESVLAQYSYDLTENGAFTLERVSGNSPKADERRAK